MSPLKSTKTNQCRPPSCSLAGCCTTDLATKKHLQYFFGPMGDKGGSTINLGAKQFIRVLMPIDLEFLQMPIEQTGYNKTNKTPVTF